MFFPRRYLMLILLAGVAVTTSSGCGMSRATRWKRPSAEVPTSAPAEPDGYYNPPAVMEPSPAPAAAPAPSFADPPPPSTSEYLAPQQGNRFRAERPGLIAPQNAKRIAPAGGQSTSAESAEPSAPSFADGPVARLEQTSRFEQFASFHGLQ